MLMEEGKKINRTRLAVPDLSMGTQLIMADETGRASKIRFNEKLTPDIRLRLKRKGHGNLTSIESVKGTTTSEIDTGE